MTMTKARTSRIGRKPVLVSPGVEVKIENQTLLVKGPKGQLSTKVHPFVHVHVENKEIKIESNNENKRVITGASKKLYKSIVGTMRATINNMMHGVTHGFEKKLNLVGVGYRAQAKGKMLQLSLGFSNPVDLSIAEGVTIETPSQTEIVIKGPNKELVGAVAAKIRSIRGPEPYKGKGVRYANEVIELKETKK